VTSRDIGKARTLLGVRVSGFLIKSSQRFLAAPNIAAPRQLNRHLMVSDFVIPFNFETLAASTEECTTGRLGPREQVRLSANVANRFDSAVGDALSRNLEVPRLSFASVPDAEYDWQIPDSIASPGTPGAPDLQTRGSRRY
jgi:hypothetical protein